MKITQICLFSYIQSVRCFTLDVENVKKNAILFIDLVNLKHMGKLLPPNWHERNATGTVNQIEGEIIPPPMCLMEPVKGNKPPSWFITRKKPSSSDDGFFLPAHNFHYRRHSEFPKG